MVRKKKSRTPKDPTAQERDRRYRAGRKRAGYKHVRVFVPGEEAGTVRALAQKLRKAAKAALARTAKKRCRVCNGNDADVPCAYPGDGRKGCLRDQRLGR